MARRDREAAVVYLHLNDILIRPGGQPDVLDHCLSLTADEADQLAGALLETAKLVRSTPPDSAQASAQFRIALFTAAVLGLTEAPKAAVERLTNYAETVFGQHR